MSYLGGGFLGDGNSKMMLSFSRALLLVVLAAAGGVFGMFVDLVMVKIDEAATLVGHGIITSCMLVEMGYVWLFGQREWRQ